MINGLILIIVAILYMFCCSVALNDVKERDGDELETILCLIPLVHLYFGRTTYVNLSRRFWRHLKRKI